MSLLTIARLGPSRATLGWLDLGEITDEETSRRYRFVGGSVGRLLDSDKPCARNRCGKGLGELFKGDSNVGLFGGYCDFTFPPTRLKKRRVVSVETTRAGAVALGITTLYYLRSMPRRCLPKNL